MNGCGSDGCFFKLCNRRTLRWSLSDLVSFYRNNFRCHKQKQSHERRKQVVIWLLITFFVRVSIYIRNFNKRFEIFHLALISSLVAVAIRRFHSIVCNVLANVFLLQVFSAFSPSRTVALEGTVFCRKPKSSVKVKRHKRIIWPRHDSGWIASYRTSVIFNSCGMIQGTITDQITVNRQTFVSHADVGGLHWGEWGTMTSNSFRKQPFPPAAFANATFRRKIGECQRVEFASQRTSNNNNIPTVCLTQANFENYANICRFNEKETNQAVNNVINSIVRLQMSVYNSRELSLSRSR